MTMTKKNLELELKAINIPSICSTLKNDDFTLLDFSALYILILCVVILATELTRGGKNNSHMSYYLSKLYRTS